MDEVPREPPELLIAEGVLHYLSETEVKALLNAVVAHFPLVAFSRFPLLARLLFRAQEVNLTMRRMERKPGITILRNAEKGDFSP